MRPPVPVRDLNQRLPEMGRISYRYCREMPRVYNKRPTADRFWEKVDKTYVCWLWTAQTVDGYGRFWLNGRPHPAHRVAYELEIGPIPDRLVVDHVCRVRRCVRPDHLRVCTASQNVLEGVTTTAALNLAKTHCPQNHPYSGDNLYVKPGGSRVCRACKRKGGR